MSIGKIAVSNTAPQPVPAATDRGALTTVMDGTVAVLSMGLAPYNLLDRALSHELIAGLAWAQREGARAVILRSSLRHFSAGADLDAMVADAGQSDILDWGLVETLRAFDEHPAPIIASVQGVCVGGGFELAMACDLIVASESAKLGSVEVTVGLHPLMGAVQRLTQRAGAARAKEMALLGRRYPATTLERWNIINWVVADEQLDSATMVLAQELAHGPSIANAATKRLVSVAVNDGIAAADEAMAEIQRPIMRSADFRAAVRSITRTVSAWPSSRADEQHAASARRHPGGGFLPRAGRPALRQDPARPGRRGHQARAAGWRPVPEGVPWPRAGLGLLRPAECGQAQREHRPQRAGGPGSGAAALRHRRRDRGELQARCARLVRARV